jgi:hypothetical protein
VRIEVFRVSISTGPPGNRSESTARQLAVDPSARNKAILQIEIGAQELATSIPIVAENGRAACHGDGWTWSF